MPPALLTDEQKQMVAEEMNTANLGPICSGLFTIYMISALAACLHFFKN